MVDTLKHWKDRFSSPFQKIKVLQKNEYESLIEDDSGNQHWVSNQRLADQQQQQQGQGQQEQDSGQQEQNSNQQQQGQGQGANKGPEFKVSPKEEIPPATWEDGNNIKLLLQNILRDNKAFRKQRKLKKGKLDLKSLTNFFTGSERIFEKRKKEGKKEYYIGILADSSGSMKRSQRDHVIKSVKKIQDMMGNWVDIYLASFDCITDMNGMNGFEGFYTNYPKRNGGTNTSDAVSRMRTEMKDCPKDRSFMIVLTDGHADNPESLRREIAATEIPILGVGIGSGANVSDFHWGEMISSGADLNKALEKFFRRTIKRRRD